MRVRTHFSTTRHWKNAALKPFTRDVLRRETGSDGLGILDAAAIERVKTEAWPEATNPDELHDSLMLIGAMPPEEIQRNARNGNAEHFISTLVAENRATRIFVPLERSDRATKLFTSLQNGFPALRQSIRTLSVSRNWFCLIPCTVRLGNAPMRFAN